jgi:hypothetical protein
MKWILSILSLTLVTALHCADTVDIEKPIIHKIVEECGYFEFVVTDSLSYVINQDSIHIDSGIEQKPFMYSEEDDKFRNFPDTVRVFNFDRDKSNKEFVFSIEVLDIYDTAYAQIFVSDQSKNLKVIELNYLPKAIEVTQPNNLDFQIVNVGDIVKTNIDVVSLYNKALNVRKIRLKRGTFFSIVNKPTDPYLLDTNETLTFGIEYSPLFNNLSIGNFDKDTLIIETDCLIFEYAISGQGAIPKIQVEDHNYGTANINTTLCKADSSKSPPTDGIRVRNTGNGYLFINNVRLKNGTHFELHNENLPVNTQIFVTQNGYDLRNICFNPKTPGEHIDTLVVSSNANGPDSIAILKGIGVEAGPNVSSLDFGRVRIGDEASGIIEIKNNGNEPAKLIDIKIANSPDFSIDISNAVPKIDDNGILVYPEKPEFSGRLHSVRIPVNFHPRSEFAKTIKITPIFEDSSKYKPGVITNYIRGYGFLPNAEFSGFDFQGRTLVNNKHPEKGIIRIWSKSQSAPLTIFSIILRKQDPQSPDDFIFPNGLPNIPANGLKLDNTFPRDIVVEFMPRNDGFRRLFIDIKHDGYEGREDSSVVTTIEITGDAYNKVIGSRPLDFRNVLNCTNEVDGLRLFNLSIDDTARILKAEIVSGDIDAYRLLTDFSQQDVILTPGQEFFMDVEFQPSVINTKERYEAFAKVYSNKDTSTVVMSGNTYKMIVDADISDIQGMIPGQFTTRSIPDKPFKPLNVFINSEVPYDSLNISEVLIEIAYDPNQLRYDHIVKGDILNNWREPYVFTKHFTSDSAVVVVELSSISGNIIQNNGILVNPVFEVLLDDTNRIDLELLNIDFGDSDDCIADSLQDGSIELSFCGQEMARIYVSMKDFGLEKINPNPVTSDNFKMNYTVAIDAHTQIAIYNARGEIIKMVEKGYLKEGIYERSIDINEFSSGSYMIKMNSGPYIKTVPLMIVK